MEQKRPIGLDASILIRSQTSLRSEHPSICFQNYYCFPSFLRRHKYIVCVPNNPISTATLIQQGGNFFYHVDTTKTGMLAAFKGAVNPATTPITPRDMYLSSTTYALCYTQ